MFDKNVQYHPFINVKLAKTICHRDIYWFVLMAGHAQMAIFKGLNIKL